MTLPATILTFTAPMPGMPDGTALTNVRGNDNILRQRLNTLRDYVGQDKAPITTVTTNTTLDADVDGGTVLVDATAGNVTVTLPAAADADERRYSIKRLDASVNTVTIAADGAELIDGSNTATLVVQYESVTIHCDGSAWWIL